MHRSLSSDDNLSNSEHVHIDMELIDQQRPAAMPRNKSVGSALTTLGRRLGSNASPTSPTSAKMPRNTSFSVRFVDVDDEDDGDDEDDSEDEKAAAAAALAAAKRQRLPTRTLSSSALAAARRYSVSTPSSQPSSHIRAESEDYSEDEHSFVMIAHDTLGGTLPAVALSRQQSRRLPTAAAIDDDDLDDEPKIASNSTTPDNFLNLEERPSLDLTEIPLDFTFGAGSSSSPQHKGPNGTKKANWMLKLEGKAKSPGFYYKSKLFIWNLFMMISPTILGRIVNSVIMFLTVGTLILFALQTEPAFQTAVLAWNPPTYPVQTAFFVFEYFAVIVFTLEYLLRLYSCTAAGSFNRYGEFFGRIRYVFSIASVIDILSFLPSWIVLIDRTSNFAKAGGQAVTGDTYWQALMGDSYTSSVLVGFRLTRILSLIKLNTHLKTLPLIWSVIMRKKNELLTSLILLVVAVFTFACCMFLLERETQTDLSSIPRAFYFGTVTLATIGYGDITPKTAWGKVATCIACIVALAVFSIPAGAISSGLIEEVEFRKKLRKRLKKEKEERKRKKLIIQRQIRRERAAELARLQEEKLRRKEEKRRLKEERAQKRKEERQRKKGKTPSASEVTSVSSTSVSTSTPGAASAASSAVTPASDVSGTSNVSAQQLLPEGQEETVSVHSEGASSQPGQETQEKQQGLPRHSIDTTESIPNSRRSLDDEALRAVQLAQARGVKNPFSVVAQRLHLGKTIHEGAEKVKDIGAAVKHRAIGIKDTVKDHLHLRFDLGERLSYEDMLDRYEQAFQMKDDQDASKQQASPHIVPPIGPAIMSPPLMASPCGDVSMVSPPLPTQVPPAAASGADTTIAGATNLGAEAITYHDSSSDEENHVPSKSLDRNFDAQFTFRSPRNHHHRNPSIVFHDANLRRQKSLGRSGMRSVSLDDIALQARLAQGHALNQVPRRHAESVAGMNPNAAAPSHAFTPHGLHASHSQQNLNQIAPQQPNQSFVTAYHGSFDIGSSSAAAPAQAAAAATTTTVFPAVPMAVIMCPHCHCSMHLAVQPTIVAGALPHNGAPPLPTGAPAIQQPRLKPALKHLQTSRSSSITKLNQS